MAASSSAPAPAPAPERWGILATIPRVCELPPGADLSLALATPPSISVLTVSPRISPDPLSERNFPSVLVADPSGLFLLHATQGAADRTAVVIGNPLLHTLPRPFVNGYFVCDARSSTAYRLPDPTDSRILDAGNLGLLTRDGGRTYLVAELQPIVGSDMAMLLRYSSETGRWTAKALTCPLAQVVRPWGSHGVFSLGKRLFWFDVSWGLLTCLPFEEEPVLEFVPLPEGCVLPFRRTVEDLQRVSCFAVSDGAVRFFRLGAPETPMVTVERFSRPVGRHGHGDEPWITSYTLYSDEETAGSWHWMIHHQVSFQDIWGHETYQASRLPKKIPKLACVDPCCASSVHFFLNNFIFCVDLSSATLRKCSRFKMDNPPRKHMSSRFVLASVISSAPSSLSAA